MSAADEVREKVGLAAFERLNEFVILLGKWRKITNLIADDSFSAIWERHILDGVLLQQCEPQALSWLDIGSGAGLPAAVIASLVAEKGGARIHCLEIDRRKCSFLREVARQLSLPMKIHNTLAEDINYADIPYIEAVTARAFSSIERIINIADPFLSLGAIAILPRGRQSPDEVAALDRERYSILVKPNSASGDGVFVRIQQRAPNPYERRPN